MNGGNMITIKIEEGKEFYAQIFEGEELLFSTTGNTEWEALARLIRWRSANYYKDGKDTNDDE